MRKITGLYLEGCQEDMEDFLAKATNHLGVGINVIEINPEKFVKSEKAE